LVNFGGPWNGKKLHFMTIWDILMTIWDILMTIWDILMTILG
jgi:hypothetical protein